MVESYEFKWKISVLAKVDTICLLWQTIFLLLYHKWHQGHYKETRVLRKHFYQQSLPFVVFKKPPPAKQHMIEKKTPHKWGTYPEICGKPFVKDVLHHWGQCVCLSTLVESGFVHSVGICRSQKLNMTVINLLTALKKENWKTLWVYRQ